MSAPRRLKRQQEKRALAPTVECTRELGPISAALLDLMNHVIDVAALDDVRLRLMLVLATAAWNEPAEQGVADELRKMLRGHFGPEAAELEELLDRLMEVRNELFANDRRVVLSTDIDYPNGRRRVLATSAVTRSQVAAARTA